MSGYLSSQPQAPETLAAAVSQHERLWNNYGNLISHLPAEGQLVIEVPNSACTYVGNTIQSSDITYRVAYTSISLKQVYRLAGFDNIEIAGIRPKRKNPTRLIKKAVIALLIKAERIKHQIFLLSCHFLHEPTIYALFKKI